MTAARWQRHVIQRLLSTLASEGGHKITTAATEGRGRTYSIAHRELRNTNEILKPQNGLLTAASIGAAAKPEPVLFCFN